MPLFSPRFRTCANPDDLQGILEDIEAFAAQEYPIGLEPAALYVTALKPAEGGRGMVLRFFNSLDQSVEGRMRLGLPAAAVWRVNLLEEDRGRLPLAEDGGLTLSVRGKEIVSLRVVPGKPQVRVHE